LKKVRKRMSVRPTAGTQARTVGDRLTPCDRVYPAGTGGTGGAGGSGGSSCVLGDGYAGGTRPGGGDGRSVDIGGGSG
jgi:hypothetical protein